MNLIKLLLVTTLFFSYTHAENLRPLLENGRLANNYAIQIHYDTDDLRLKIITTFEPLEINSTNHYVIIEVDENEHQKLLDLDLNVTIDSYFTELINTTSTETSNQSKALTSNLTTTGNYPTISGYSCYRTVEGTFTTAQNIVSNYPNLAQWIDVGDSWNKENGLGGYDMRVLKLTNLSNTQSKPALFITSSIHAREYTPAELATRFAEYLVSNYGTNADVTWMLNHHEVHLMLMANPDGRKHAETGQSWRKNVNDNYCASGTTPGADLNRNFDFEWDCCGGSSNNECSLTYHGAAASSEPETQAIQTYMRNLFGDHRGPNINDAAPLNTAGIYIDIHSYSELILWPWGYTDSVAPNNMVSLGRKFAYSNSYTPKQAIGLYPTDGTTDDFAYGELGIPSYTFELGTSFFQSCSTFTNTILPDNMPSLIYALKAVRSPYTLPLGPEITNLSLSTGNTTVPRGTIVTLTGIANDTRYNNSQGLEPTQNIAQVEYYIDVAPWESNANAIPINAQDGHYNNSIEPITKTIDTGLLNEGNHTIFVRAKDADNHWGVISALFLNIATQSQSLPTAPTNLNTSNVTSNSARLTWSDNSNNETGFKIYRGNTQIATVGANTTSYNLTGLSANTTYTYTVKAYNTTGTSAATSKTFTTLVAPNTIPTIPFNTNVNNTWISSIASTHRNGRYARYYTFTLTQSTNVTIDLTSTKDTYLFLLSGVNKNGSIVAQDDDGGSGYNSKITRTLAAGNYTIEATTYSTTTGSFTLKVSR